MESTNSGYKRVRTRKACLPCSRRKRKCNGEFPCDVCTGYGYECSYRLGPSQRDTPSQRLQSRPHYGYPGTFEFDRSRRDGEDSQTVLNAASNVSSMPLRAQQNNDEVQLVPPSRYLGRYSAEAFPRFLAIQMQAQLLPKLQPFAWNLSARPKPPPNVKAAICSVVSLDAAQYGIRSFFSLDFPASACLNLDSLLTRCENHWHGHNQGLAFEAIISGIVCLAGILKYTPNSQQEACLIEHAGKILDDPAILGEATIDVLLALVLRYLYQRAAATPQVTWLTICTAMHMAESLGLHKQYCPSTDRDHHMINGWNDEARSFLFWLISSGNRLSSHELGRTPVVLHGVTRSFPFSDSDTSGIATFCRIAHLLPLDLHAENLEDDLHRFSEALRKLMFVWNDQPFLRLIRADVCFIIYRRIRVSTMQNITKQQCQQVLSVGREAVQAARRLVQERRPWWNIISTLFQFCCTLISMDSVDSLADLNSVMRTIDLVRTYYPNFGGAEAVTTLKSLIAALRQRKQTEIECLDLESTQESLDSGPFDFALHGDLTSSEPVLDDLPQFFEDLDWMSSNMVLGQ